MSSGLWQLLSLFSTFTLVVAAASAAVVVTVLYVGDGGCSHCCCRHRSLCWRWQLRPLLLSSPFFMLAMAAPFSTLVMAAAATAVVVTVLYIGININWPAALDDPPFMLVLVGSCSCHHHSPRWHWWLLPPLSSILAEPATAVVVSVVVSVVHVGSWLLLLPLTLFRCNKEAVTWRGDPPSSPRYSTC